MKRPLIIILGLLIILILVGVWVYFLLTGSAENTEDQFGSLDFADTTDTSIVPVVTEEPESPTVALGDSDALQQLTTESVAGFTEVRYNASTTPRVHYLVSGTGHIFSIDLVSGEEKRISATTIPLAKKAALTPNGAYVMIQAGEGTNAEFIIGVMSTSSDKLSNFKLPEQNPVLSFAATHENEFLYVVADGNNSLAKAYNPRTNAIRVLFTIPFRDMTVQWHHTASGPHLVYPKTTSKLPGQLYSYKDGLRARLAVEGFGLSAVGSSRNIIASKVNQDGSYRTEVTSRVTDQVLQTPLTLLPEKCVFSTSKPNEAWCGVTLADYSRSDNMPDAWYRGQQNMQDALWSINTDSTVSSMIVNLSLDTGQDFDLIEPMFNPSTSRFYFKNKIDNTLWMYDLTR